MNGGVPALGHRVLIAAEDGRLGGIASVLRLDGHDVRVISRVSEMLRFAGTWPARVVILEMRFDTPHNAALIEPLSLLEELALLIVADSSVPAPRLARARELGVPTFLEPIQLDDLRAAVRTALEPRRN